MLGNILAMVGVIYLIYIAWNVRKINKERKDRIKELEIVYSIGLKEYNKSICRHPNQSQQAIIS